MLSVDNSFLVLILAHLLLIKCANLSIALIKKDKCCHFSAKVSLKMTI